MYAIRSYYDGGAQKQIRGIVKQGLEQKPGIEPIEQQKQQTGPGAEDLADDIIK